MEVWHYVVIAPLLVMIFTLFFIDAIFGALDDAFGGIVEIVRETISRVFRR